MNRFLLFFLLVFFLYGQDVSVQGDPSELSHPGGYIGISYEFDKKNNIKGYQVSIGFAVPSIGNPGQGPYLFSGFAFGKKYLSKEKKSYRYNDLQINYINYGFWSGAAYGIAYIDGKKLKRRKYFGGYLLAGYYKENIDIPELDLQNNTFSGYHVGLPIPIIGNHFHP